MKHIFLWLTLAAMLVGAPATAQQRGKNTGAQKIEGCQKVRQTEDFDTYDRYTPFSSKDTKKYFVDYDYTAFSTLGNQKNPDWGSLRPVMNYLEKVSRAPLSMCAVYAVNPEVTDRADRERLLRQAEDEASNALAAFDKWRVGHEMRNKIQYFYTEVDYRYFKGAAYYNEQVSADLIHVGLVLYMGTKKRPLFEVDTNSRHFADIKFFPNDATIVDSWESTLDELATYLKENDRKTVLLTGYTDNQGTEAYSLGLSRQRAVEIKKALQRRGIDPTRIEVQGLGSDNPVGDNDTYEGRVANNRVSIKIQ